MGIRYPKYVFLTYGTYETYWWSTYSDSIECSPEDIADVLKYSLAATHFNVLSNESLFYRHCYDATMVLAYVLNYTLNDAIIPKFGKDVNTTPDPSCSPAKDSSFGRSFTQRMKQYLQEIDFEGISVRRDSSVMNVHTDENFDITGHCSI